jgi:hypothetical protein
MCLIRKCFLVNNTIMYKHIKYCIDLEKKKKKLQNNSLKKKVYHFFFFKIFSWV